MFLCLSTAGDEWNGLPATFLRTRTGQIEGKLLSLKDDRVRMRANGTERTEPLNAFREVRWATRLSGAVDSPFILWPVGGGQLFVHRIRPAHNGLTVSGYGWTLEATALSALHGFALRQWLERASQGDRAELRSLRTDPPRDRDVLLAVRGEERRKVRCIVHRVEETGVAVHIGNTVRHIDWEHIGWVVLASSETGARPMGHMLETVLGSRFRVDDLEIADGTFQARGQWGYLRGAADRLRSVHVWSDAYRYLSDMPPAQVNTEPFLDVVWPAQFDRAINGDPIRLDDKTYGKGIGMDTHTEMTFALDGRYSHFHALIGVDEASGGLGSVVFRVNGDGELLFESSPRSGAQRAMPLMLSVAGVRRLSLEADFGNPVDASGNLADWAEARVVREAVGATGEVDQGVVE